MGYKLEDGSGKTVNIPIRCVPAPDYREIYAHGAKGGVLGTYHYRIDFYRDDVPPLTFIERDGKITGLDAEKAGIERRIQCSVYLSLPFAKELIRWLDKNLNEYEEEHGAIHLSGEPTTKPSGGEKKE